MAAFAAAGDSESETMRAVRALEAAECVYAKVPFPAVIVAVEDRSLTEDGSAIYVLAVRPHAQAVIVFGTRLVKPEPA